MKKKNLFVTKKQLSSLSTTINEAPIDYEDRPERMDPTLQGQK